MKASGASKQDSKQRDIRDWTEGEGMAQANKAKIHARTVANHQQIKKRNIQMQSNDPSKSFFLKRKRVDWVGKQTRDDDMFMFVICNLRSTIHDTPGRNAVLSTTQADDRPIIDFGSDVSTCQKESRIQYSSGGTCANIVVAQCA